MENLTTGQALNARPAAAAYQTAVWQAVEWEPTPLLRVVWLQLVPPARKAAIQRQKDGAGSLGVAAPRAG